MQNHFDVLIVGAGLSGIGAGVHLQKNLPNKSYAILEGRERLGGTWDLFRYPGIRSDSDMYTLGYAFKPWKDNKAIADGPVILDYLKETAEENGVDKHIRYNHMVKDANYDSSRALWTVDVEVNGEMQQFTAHYLFMCAGYYKYSEGYRPDFPGEENYKGQFVHPQFWPEDLDYEGKKVVVIGSGATAVTLVPAMTDKAEKVTMLQRTPSYVISRPNENDIGQKIRKFLPEKVAYSVQRAIAVVLGTTFYNLSRSKPERVKKMLLGEAKRQLKPGYDMKHFTPPYNPWDQRVCAVPNGDLFKAINAGKAEVVTDHIDHFTENGIKLKSGEELEADIVITATGLVLQLIGGVELTVDGEKKDLSKSFSYKAMMLSDIPNMAFVIGYTNSSWTLKSDLTSEYFCRLIQHTEKTGNTQFVPRAEPDLQEEPLLSFNSGYVTRSIGQFPKQGDRMPWKVYQNYIKDKIALGYGKVNDGAVEFSDPTKGAAKPSPEAMAAE